MELPRGCRAAASPTHTNPSQPAKQKKAPVLGKSPACVASAELPCPPRPVTRQQQGMAVPGPRPAASWEHPWGPIGVCSVFLTQTQALRGRGCLLVPWLPRGAFCCAVGRRVGTRPHSASVVRAEGGWAPSSSGRPGTGAASTTAATVTVTPTASTRCPSAAPRSTVTCPGTARPAPPPSPPPTAVATRTRSRL